MQIRAFATALRAALVAADLSQRQFAKAVGTTQSAVSHYLAGRAPPPLPDLALWIKALRVPSNSRERFALLAMLAHCPQEIETDYLRQEERIARLEEVVRQFQNRRAGDADP